MTELAHREPPSRLFAILITGVVVRGVVIAATSGTSDLYLWQTFAEAIQQYGLAAYAHAERLNHPPLGALLVWVLYRIGPLSYTLRISQGLSDVAAAVVIYKVALLL